MQDCSPIYNAIGTNKGNGMKLKNYQYPRYDRYNPSSEPHHFVCGQSYIIPFLNNPITSIPEVHKGQEGIDKITLSFNQIYLDETRYAMTVIPTPYLNLKRHGEWCTLTIHGEIIDDKQNLLNQVYKAIGLIYSLGLLALPLCRYIKPIGDIKTDTITYDYPEINTAEEIINFLLSKMNISEVELYSDLRFAPFKFMRTEFLNLKDKKTGEVKTVETKYSGDYKIKNRKNKNTGKVEQIVNQDSLVCVYDRSTKLRETHSRLAVGDCRGLQTYRFEIRLTGKYVQHIGLNTLDSDFHGFCFKVNRQLVIEVNKWVTKVKEFREMLNRDSFLLKVLVKPKLTKYVCTKADRQMRGLDGVVRQFIDGGDE